ncbi:hypothetical protein VaNZ11_010572 [Volvox africanus]|uniref:RAP domain-containing protein n=1 Tax=Volvox africanus TaxID=51714 RepID=A0ABQ5SAR7_9CHLO|nr:hypothetical protein VaNZ11_010572 [Volvox africanus]
MKMVSLCSGGTPMIRAGRQRAAVSAYNVRSSYRWIRCDSSSGSVAASRDWRAYRQRQPGGKGFQPSSREMQMLKADEHSFFWGQPARVAKGAGPTQGPSKDLPSCRDVARANLDPDTPLNHMDAAAEVVRTPCVVPVAAARFHSIVGAMTVSELMQELLEVLAQGSTNSRSQMVPVERTSGNVMLYGDCFLEAAVLPPQVVEVALAKTAGWALDRGAKAGSDPDAVRLTMELLQYSLRLSLLQGYSLDDVSSVLWSLASVLGQYGWGPADGIVEVVQFWLGGSETVAALEGGTEAARFSVLASLLWGYAALLQTGNTETGPAAGDASGAVEMDVLISSSGVKQAAGLGLDVLARRAAELVRAYGNSEPVAAVELADVAWALSMIRHRSSACAQLAEAVAHEVFRQLSNRSSINTPFEPSDLIKVVRAFADLGMDGFDGSVSGQARACEGSLARVRGVARGRTDRQSHVFLPCAVARSGQDPRCSSLKGSTSVQRMLDAIGGHVAKQIRNRHVGAITRPADCAELLRGFADAGHSTVVVPELLKAVAMQVSREVANHNIAASRLVGDMESCRDADRVELWQSHKQQAHWHWCSFLDSVQVISILSSYIHMGYYPGGHLVDSLLLVIQPQLLYMSSGEVSELLQLLAAARHVPGPQSLNLLASAAFDFVGTGPARNIPLGGSQSDRQAQGRTACPLQQLASLWALVMMGWRPEPMVVAQVLLSVMSDDAPQMDIQDVGRVMSLLCVLPPNELTIQRFGLAAIKLRYAIAAKSSTLLELAGNHDSISNAKLRLSSIRVINDLECILQQQLLPTLLASGVAMTLLGAEGWEMAEQLLPTSHFRLLEGTLRRVLERPYDGIDGSYIEDIMHGLREVGCFAGVQTFAIPVDELCPVFEGNRRTISMDGMGFSGDEQDILVNVDPNMLKVRSNSYTSHKPLVFQPLLAGIKPRDRICSTMVTPQPAPGTWDDRVFWVGEQCPGQGMPHIPGTSSSSSGIVILQICLSGDYSNNAVEEMLWGWSQVRKVLYENCMRIQVILLSEGKLRKVKGKRDELYSYVYNVINESG